MPDAANRQELPWYFESGENSWGDRPQTLADLGLDSLQQARVLEWFAFKVWVASNEGTPDGDYHSKSYDPLTIELDSHGGGTAHSYVFNLNTGGRHHGFSSLAELERLLFEEAIGTVKWAYGHGQEDALEALARFFWLDSNPGKEETWDSWGDDRLDWKFREPYYDRAREILKAEAESHSSDAAWGQEC